jgi:ABC transporter transmembrane region 2
MKLANHLLGLIKAMISSRERKIAASGALIGILYALHWFQNKNSSKYSGVPKAKRNDRGAVNVKFFSQLWELIKIVVPSVNSKESFLLVLLSVLLVARTLLSISISSVNGGVVKAIVTKDFNLFLNKVNFK